MDADIKKDDYVDCLIEQVTVYRTGTRMLMLYTRPAAPS